MLSSGRPVILVVEDDWLIAMDMAALVERFGGASVEIATSASEARILAARTSFDFAFLDVNVTDGDTFDLARFLLERGVECAFVSGALVDSVPQDLGRVPFIPKPCTERIVQRALDRRFRDQRGPGAAAG